MDLNTRLLNVLHVISMWNLSCTESNVEPMFNPCFQVLGEMNVIYIQYIPFKRYRCQKACFGRFRC